MARIPLYDFLGRIPEDWYDAIREITDLRAEAGDPNANLRSTINGLIFSSLKKLYPELQMTEKEEWVLGTFKAPKKSWISEMFEPVAYISNPRPRPKKRRRDDDDDDDED